MKTLEGRVATLDAHNLTLQVDVAKLHRAFEGVSKMKASGVEGFRPSSNPGSDMFAHGAFLPKVIALT